MRMDQFFKLLFIDWRLVQKQILNSQAVLIKYLNHCLYCLLNVGQRFSFEISLELMDACLFVAGVYPTCVHIPGYVYRHIECGKTTNL